MPELPEVELVAQSLDKLARGRRIVAAKLIRERLAPESSPALFAERLSGAAIRFVHRRGKHILFDLDNKRTLITHLRMSGRFMMLPAERDNPKFTHAVFYFDDETRLLFQDQRHFGLMKIVETSRLGEAKEIQKLAPEPFSDAFSLKYLRDTLKTSKRTVKEFLLDQTKVCGLGNIYASESMFLANIDPKKIANKLSKKKAEALYDKIREILSEAVSQGSTLNVDPENIDGSYYIDGFETRWRVYDREDLPCTHCKTPIIRLKQGGRSTYFCRKCQR
ncbi:MAG: bifunctional DNA-formamidopyrimidine glycosylase/DNA-(apurinic or apyrimidinic site) lyase [Saprospiraceae bacterium]|nr:bifunctional DNA-formamidopyrimidine glycosylase/DNA-(apurinic or apyrimidinic site) lyase [Pyrinomonadaceae bacterium]